MVSLRWWSSVLFASSPRALSAWEKGEYIAFFFVVLACFGEFAAEFTNIFSGGDTAKKRGLEKASALVLVVALSFELLCTVRTNEISGGLFDTISSKASAAKDAATAAATAARGASELSGEAKRTSEGANKAAGQATHKAKAVDAEVGGLEKRTSLLKKEAASLQHDLTLQLSREGVFVKRGEDFENTLQPFAGQKVDVRYAANLEDPSKTYDPETYWFAFQLSFALQQAHWLSPYVLRDVPAEHGTGVFISVSPRSSQRTRDAAEALAKVLVAIPVEVHPAMKGRSLSFGSLISIDQPPRLSQRETALYPPLDDETIVVEVAPHP